MCVCDRAVRSRRFLFVFVVVFLFSPTPLPRVLAPQLSSRCPTPSPFLLTRLLPQYAAEQQRGRHGAVEARVGPHRHLTDEEGDRHTHTHSPHPRRSASFLKQRLRDGKRTGGGRAGHYAFSFPPRSSRGAGAGGGKQAQKQTSPSIFFVLPPPPPPPPPPPRFPALSLNMRGCFTLCFVCVCVVVCPASASILFFFIALASAEIPV